METAMWILAIVGIIRIIQNGIQLAMMIRSYKNDQLKRATDEFIKSLNKSDAEFMADVMEKIKEQNGQIYKTNPRPRC